MALTDITTYHVAHNKNGSSGGNTYIMGGQKSSIYNSLNVHSINASQGNIDYLKVKSMSANDASILYLQTREGSIQKLDGDILQYNTGYIGSLATDTLSTKKLKAEDIEAINAFISTIQSKEITTEYLTVTKQAHFFELIIDKIRAVGGQLILTPASCVVDYVWGITSGGDRIPATPDNLNQIVAFDVYWRATEDTGRSVTNDFIVNDQVICQSFNNVSTGTSYNVSNKYYWRLVNSILADTYVNLTTGAISASQQNATNNSYEVIMKLTQTKNNDTYIDNGIIWNVAAQTIQGIQTNVSWTNSTLESDEAVHGIFNSASQIYGIQITPDEDIEVMPITSKLDLNIKQIVDNSYIIPNKINIGVYFEDDSFLMFNDVLIDANGNVTFDLDNPDAPIEAITIVSTAEVNWHLCHCMRVSNTVCDTTLEGYSAIPSTGDNLVQLGYRGGNDADRQSAIIISAYKSPDPDVYAPSYAQYMGINDFNLGTHRGSYIDARGAKFVGDITLCSVNGKTIGEALADQEDEIEKKNKKLVVDASSIQVYTEEGSTTDEVSALIPSHINVSILAPVENGMTSLTTVPEGYKVEFNFFNYNHTDVSSNNFTKTQSQSLSNIELPTGTYVGDISTLRIRLIKDEAGVPAANAIVVDYIDLSYIRAAVPSVDGGHYEFRYKNATSAPTKPTTGTSGLTDGWAASATTPDFANGEFTWMTQCYCTAANEYGTWTNPVRITGDNGIDGEDGTDIEFIYTRNNTGVAPAAPPQNQIDDWYGYDSNTGYTWTDNPAGVASNLMYEYISTRTKENGTWSAFSTPVVWSKWGEKGMDGDGYEYIFKLSADNTNPGAPSDSPQSDDYVPTGWSDDPESVSQLFPYQWCSVRKKTNGTWGSWSTPALWARYAEQGETGGHYEFRYKNNSTQPNAPTGTGLTDGWSNTPTNPDVENGVYTWMSQSYVTPGSNGDSDTYGTWSTPIRITGGKGEAGADGTDIEFIYTRNNTGVAPSTPATSQTDDYVPTGWTDNPAGVASNLMYEYISTRTKENGTWSAFSTPVVWSKWGEKGMDGDGYEYIYKLTATNDTPTTPSDSPQTDDYVPTGWTDEPGSVTQLLPYQWCSVRKKTNGTWGAFSTPALWSRYAEQGATGGHYEFRYKNATSAPTKPTAGTSGLTDGWAASATTPDFANGYYTWMTQCYTTSTNEYGTWTDPVRITGDNGQDGEDGTEIEFIYTRNNTGTAPAAPATNQTDDWYGTSGGVTWTDNPQGVQADMMYEYVTTRTKKQDVWSAYSTPVVWSKWGEKGMDGDGYEYIYKLTATADVPANPTPSNTSTTAYQSSEYIPTGWTDDPGSVSESTPYQWVCVRERHNGTWGAFSTPALWSRWATQGAAGGHYEFRYKNSLTQPNAPTGTGETNGWSRTPSTPTDAEKYTWMSQTYVNGNDEYGTWTTPIRITGPQGEHGADGNDIEFIYTRNNTGVAPSTPATSQSDDYIPSGWTDNPAGVSSNMMYEYISTRTKENGTWSAFSTPVVWSKWGEKGMDGDGYEYIYKATSNSTAPTNPTPASTSSTTYQTDDYVPTGWDDEPVSLTSTNAFLWVCVRKKTNGVWGSFSNPALWSHYAVAEEPQPGQDGADAEFNYLVPNKETLMAMIINSISNNANCDLKCELDYTLCHVKGSTVTTISWSTSPYVLKLEAFNASGTKIGNTIYLTSNGYSSGTPQGTYTNSNLLATLNSVAAQRDYMKCYTQYNSNCPVYIQVSLMSGNTVIDKRVVNVELENGAVLKVTDDAINSAVAQANTNMNTTLNNYSTTSQTATLISNTVNAQLSNYSTTAQMNSAIEQSASQITSTVESNYYNKNQIDSMLDDTNSFKWLIDLKSRDQNTYYPVGVRLLDTSTGRAVGDGLVCQMQVDRSLNEGGSPDSPDWYGSPSWGSTYPGASYGRGVALLCQWSIVPSEWGAWGNDSLDTNRDNEANTTGNLFVDRYILKYTAKGSNTNDGNNESFVKVIGNLQEHNPSSTMIFYLRGGSKYNFRCNWDGVKVGYYGSSSTNPGYDTNTTASYTTKDPNRDPTTYNTITGADSQQIYVPIQDRQSKSQILQTAKQISLNVYQQTDEGLKKTGIDITSGQINLNSDNTNVNGTLNIYNQNCGFQVWDSTKTSTVQIRNDKMGQIKDYQFTGAKPFSCYKEGYKGSSNSSTPFTVAFDKVDIGTFSSEIPCKIVSLLFTGIQNPYSSESTQLYYAGPMKTITKIEWKVEILNSSNTVLKTNTYTFDTWTDITRSFYGYPFNTDIEYTPTSSVQLYVRTTMRMWTEGAGNNPCNWQAWYNFETYTELNGAQRISVDGAVFTSGNSGVNYEYVWWGKYKNPSRMDSDYGFLVRNRNHNFKVTPVGIMRTMMDVLYGIPGASESSQWLVNDQISGDTPGAAKWCDISSCVPVLNVTATTSNWSTATISGTPLIAQVGLVCNTGNGNLTINLPDPSKWPGKKILFKGVTHGIRFTCDSSNKFVFDDDTRKVNTIPEDGYSSTTGCLISNGSYWIHFNSN